jgi:hypothetical protein
MKFSPLLVLPCVLLGYLAYLRFRARQAVRQVTGLQRELRLLSQNELVEPASRSHLAQLASERHEGKSHADLHFWLGCAHAAADRAKRAIFGKWDSWVDGLGPTAA